MDIQIPRALQSPTASSGEHSLELAPPSLEDILPGGLAALGIALHAEKRSRSDARHSSSPHPFRIAVAALGFFALWFVFYAAWQTFPYLSSGSDVVFHAKLRAELSGKLFAARAPGTQKVLIFGTSKILAGFIPRQFDESAATADLHLQSFNSGYPARSTFVPELARMSAAGTVPDVLLLTEAWSGAPAPDIFRPIENEHALADTLFPFRHLLRDSLSFAQNARAHGGYAAYYGLARRNVDQMLSNRGYYFIAEQSHYPHDRLPDSFSLPTDIPTHVAARSADPHAPEAAELRRIFAMHPMHCYYVPAYARLGAVAAAPESNTSFTEAAHAVGCRVLGPDYFRYPNSFFSDEIHLNPDGARSYTADLLRTLKPVLSSAEGRR